MRAGIPGLKFPVAAQLGGGAATPHHATHQTGGTDALAGTIDANGRVIVDLDGTAIGTRRKIAFRTGLAGGPTAADDAGNEQVIVTLPTRPPASKVTSCAASYSAGSKLYASAAVGGVTSTVAMSAGTIHAYKHWWPFGYEPPTIGMEVATLGTSAHLKLALYQYNTDDSIGARICVTGDLDASSTGVKTTTKTLDSGQTWPGPGFVWFMAVCDVAISVRGAGSLYNANMLPYKTAGGTAPIPSILVFAQSYASAFGSGLSLSSFLASALAVPYGLLGT